MLSPRTCIWPVEMPSSESVNSLHLEAEMPPALTAQGGGIDPVDGQLLANLPDLGVKEEGWVNDGFLSRNPHLGVVHLHIHGLSLIHLLENNTHAYTHSHVCYVYTRQSMSNPVKTSAPHTVYSHAFALASPEPCSSSQPRHFIYHLCVCREDSNFPTPDSPCPDSLLLLSVTLSSSLRHALSIIHHWNSQTVMIWLLNDFRSGLHYSKCGCNIV